MWQLEVQPSTVGEELGGVGNSEAVQPPPWGVWEGPAEQKTSRRQGWGVKPTLGGALHSAALSPLHFDLNQQGI